MSTGTRHLRHLGLALAIALAAGGCALGPREPGTASSVPPSPTPTAPQAWTTFTSDRYGYAMDHPVDWHVREAPGEAFVPGMRPRSSGTDNFASPDAHRYGGDDGLVVVAALPLEGSETLDDFTARASTATPCGAGAARDPIMLDGEPAQSRYFTCGAHDWLQHTALHGDHGFIVWLVTTVPPGPGNRDINDQFLASFRFTE